VTELRFRYNCSGIHLPDLGLWLDPQRAQRSPDRVFVSHAHSDHIARHQEILATAPTARFLAERLGGQRQEQRLQFNQPADFPGPDRPWQITLLPAGHILGSAMAFIESTGSSLLYTGDFKLRPGLCAEVCQPRHAETLIMETTFGRARYQFPAAGEVMRSILRFCREAIDAGESAVLLAYSLGKSQELLRGLRSAGLAIRLHENTHRLSKIHEEFGAEFPPFQEFSGELNPGEVLIAPPGARLPATTGGGRRLRTAVATGWALDSSTIYQYGVDAAFPLSDHADFNELIEFVRLVHPKRIFTLHGFAAEFAATLRDLGFDARALGVEEQLTLRL
jgi:Cft2 family RNA processing exonuclease